MRPVTVSCVVDSPRERIFDYLADVANHAEFTDHFLERFRLERMESRGRGAAARFRVRRPVSMWAEIVLAELERPYRIGIEGEAGRLGRIKTRAEYRLIPHDQGMTRVELTFSAEPATPSDRLREALGGRAWLRHQSQRALRRMRSILEQGEPSARAVRAAAG